MQYEDPKRELFPEVLHLKQMIANFGMGTEVIIPLRVDLCLRTMVTPRRSFIAQPVAVVRHLVFISPIQSAFFSDFALNYQTDQTVRGICTSEIEGCRCL